MIDIASTLANRLTAPEIYAIKESGKVITCVQRQDMCDILIWPNDDNAACIPIDATHVINVIAGDQIRTEGLFVIDKA